MVELIYFAGPGRAEVTRLTLAAGNVEYKDTRIEFPEWPAIKADPNSVPGSLFGFMPCITDGDLKVTQYQHVAQYAADLAFPSRTAKERAIDGMFLGAHNDLQVEMYKCLFGEDAAKEEAKKNLNSKVNPILEKIEKLLPADGFINKGAAPTLGDLAIFDFVSSPFPGLKALGVDLAAYTKLVGLVERVKGHESLKAYLEKRGF